MIRCTFEDNGSALLRHVTVNSIVIRQTEVLLGKRAMRSGLNLEGGKWSLLGGFVNRDENLIEAAKREVFEESGWKTDNLQLFHIKDNPNRPKEDRQNIEFVFLAQAVKKVGVPDGEAEPRWFSVSKLPPKTEIAFDHGDDLELYKRYIRDRFSLPVFLH